MKHIINFNKFKINEFFDFEKVFDIDEDVISYVFSDILNKYTFLGIKLVEIDKNNFKIEIFDKDPTPENNNLKDEFRFIKLDKNYLQIKAHFDSMDFSIKSCLFDEGKNIITFEIHQLI